MSEPAAAGRARVAILTEAGGAVGFGHLTRMHALAEAFERAGNTVTFVVQWEGLRRTTIPVARAEIHFENWRKAARLDEIAAADITIIDSYLLRDCLYSQFRKHAPLLVAVDDFYRVDIDDAVVLNPNCYGSRDGYPLASLVLTGPDYVIVRHGVVARRGGQQPARIPCTVLVTLGGADRTGLGLRLGRALAEAGLKTTVIQTDRASLKCDNPMLTVRSQCDEDAFITHLLTTGVVVCGGGQTLVESLVLGCPVVPIEMGECHRHMIAFAVANGMMEERIHFTMAAVISKATAAVRGVMPEDRASKQSRAAALFVDGMGAARAADAISRAYAQHSLK